MSTSEYTPTGDGATPVPREIYEQIVARVQAECEALGGVSERAYRRRLAKAIKAYRDQNRKIDPSTIRGKGFLYSDPTFRIVSHECHDNCVVCGKSAEGDTRVLVNAVMSGRFMVSFDGRDANV